MAPDTEKKVYMVQLIEFLPTVSSSTKKDRGLHYVGRLTLSQVAFLFFFIIQTHLPRLLSLSLPLFPFPFSVFFFSFSAALQLQTQIIFSLPLLFNLAARA